MTVEKKNSAVTTELLDRLLVNYQRPEDLIGENGLLKRLTNLLRWISHCPHPVRTDSYTRKRSCPVLPA